MPRHPSRLRGRLSREKPPSEKPPREKPKPLSTPTAHSRQATYLRTQKSVPRPSSPKGLATFHLACLRPGDERRASPCPSLHCFWAGIIPVKLTILVVPPPALQAIAEDTYVAFHGLFLAKCPQTQCEHIELPI